MRTEDGYFIDKCLNKEPAAFGLLVEKYKSGIYALAYAKLGNFHDAEDITQEVFLKAYQKLRTLRRGDNFHAWLYAITSNLCKNFLRSQSRQPDRELIANQAPKNNADSSMAAYHKASLYEPLYDALEELPEIHRQVLTLYYLGGMSSLEIAQFLGMSESTINMRLSRARDRVRHVIPSALRLLRSTVASPPNRAYTFLCTRLSSQILLVFANPSNFLISRSSSIW